jgi:acetylornithine deacetylase/succinyl-diaminopimelate desuccinylase-like protein
MPGVKEFAASAVAWLAVVASAPSDSVAVIVQEPVVRSALDAIRAAEPRTVADQVRFCEVPAPPFEETARGALLQRLFVEIGLEDVRIDDAGNVLGTYRGVRPRPHLVVASHLDTVFPRETNVKVTREGNRLRGPGIGDNCRGLAVLVAVARTVSQKRVRTAGTITFVANVGEEGLGDLRGVKQLFSDTLAGAIDRFVSIDGGGLSALAPQITHVAVGSHRYRVTFKGPGGHSFGAFGLPSAVGALGRAVGKIQAFQVPSIPRTTFNVGRIGGSTAVNAIPFEAWMEVDLRSSDPDALASLDARLQQALDAATAEENQRWGKPGAITFDKQLVGARPAGSLPPTAWIVETARAAAEALGLAPILSEGSTDSNLPLSLGVPAITISGGGAGFEAHALGEWFDATDAWKGSQHALLVTIALAN